MNYIINKKEYLDKNIEKMIFNDNNDYLCIFII